MNLVAAVSLLPLLVLFVYAQDQCNIATLQRSRCGWPAIPKARCLRRGCCYDPNRLNINRCYHKKFDACDVTITNRRLCKNRIVLLRGPCEKLDCCFSFTLLAPFHCYEKKAFDPCEDNPCENGGVCVAVGANYTCTCSKQWTGSDCQIAVDPCAADPCLHGGTCTGNGASFTCSCATGWTGNTCQTASGDINVCAISNPCKNGGTCVKFGNGYQCRCALGWAGDNCEMTNAACQAVRPEMRINCGWSSVTQEQCNARSCCYDTSISNRPYCFYSADKCDKIALEERVDCGFDGISYDQCLGRGCCFDDDDSNPGPICYRGARPECRGVKAANRVAQGRSGIQPNECNEQGWCFDTTAEPNCFTRA